MKVVAIYDPPPIPIRDYDWIAYDDDTYDGGQPLGRGKTRADAIADLLAQLEDDA